MQRRRFLQAAGGSAAMVVFGGRHWQGPTWAAEVGPQTGAAPSGEQSASGLSQGRPVVIERPFHGAVLNRRQGEQTAEGLRIAVRGWAPEGWQVRVNGQPAARNQRAFETSVVLKERETEIAAAAEGPDGQKAEDRVRVVWDRHSFPRYRVAIDDNSFFLRDIAQKQYKSLFDCFYLANLRKLHQKYGTKFVLNTYYTTGEDFNLSQFPDRYRAEWRDNANWLRLAFHAWANDPPRPYQEAPAEKVLHDFDKVTAEIKRFAGEEAYSPTTVIHFAMTRHEVFKPLYERGVRALSGYFRKNAEGRWDINYRWDDVRSEYVFTHDVWKDFESGIVFSKVDIVMDQTPVEKIVPTLEPLTKDPNTAELMDLLTHEQYFWPFYVNYRPDMVQRVETAVRFVTERGYKPVFFHEGLLGAPVE